MMQLCFILAAWDSGLSQRAVSADASKLADEQRGQRELLSLLDSVASIRERLSRVFAEVPFRALVGASCLRS
eukprot:12085585-Alexandrium_andersonii.AAC.1